MISDGIMACSRPGGAQEAIYRCWQVAAEETAEPPGAAGAGLECAAGGDTGSSSAGHGAPWRSCG